MGRVGEDIGEVGAESMREEPEAKEIGENDRRRGECLRAEAVMKEEEAPGAYRCSTRSMLLYAVCL